MTKNVASLFQGLEHSFSPLLLPKVNVYRATYGDSFSTSFQKTTELSKLCVAREGMLAVNFCVQCHLDNDNPTKKGNDKYKGILPSGHTVCGATTFGDTKSNSFFCSMKYKLALPLDSNSVGFKFLGNEEHLTTECFIEDDDSDIYSTSCNTRHQIGLGDTDKKYGKFININVDDWNDGKTFYGNDYIGDCHSQISWGEYVKKDNGGDGTGRRLHAHQQLISAVQNGRQPLA